MRILIQRTTNARVDIAGETVARIDKGFLVLVGITEEDTEEDAKYLAKKLAQLRVFEDAEGKMNLSVKDISGAILSVSQFTLYADTRKGNRPSFIHAARPEKAEPLYEYFNSLLHREYGLEVQTGCFGADMKVRFTNDGPVTIWIDSTERHQSRNQTAS